MRSWYTQYQGSNLQSLVQRTYPTVGSRKISYPLSNSLKYKTFVFQYLNHNDLLLEHNECTNRNIKRENNNTLLYVHLFHSHHFFPSDHKGRQFSESSPLFSFGLFLFLFSSLFPLSGYHSFHIILQFLFFRFRISQEITDSR